MIFTFNIYLCSSLQIVLPPKILRLNSLNVFFSIEILDNYFMTDPFKNTIVHLVKIQNKSTEMFFLYLRKFQIFRYASRKLPFPCYIQKITMTEVPPVGVKSLFHSENSHYLEWYSRADPKHNIMSKHMLNK